MKKATVTQKQSLEASQTSTTKDLQIEFANAFIYEGSSLNRVTDPKLLNSGTSVQKQFRSAKELAELVTMNTKPIFGQQSFFIPFPAKAQGLFGKGFDPAGFLLDFSDSVKPKFYVLEIQLANQDFYARQFARINRFVSYFKNETSFEKLCKLIRGNKRVEIELRARMKESAIAEYLAATIVNRSFILFITDDVIKELSEVMSIYANELQKLVKTIFIRKFLSNGKTIYTIVPIFSELHVNGKKRIPNTPVDENYHLDKASDEIRAVYGKMKVELLKIDKQIQFNPQRYYISLRKDRNIAFFHFSKKRINLVVKHPENETKKQIKHHQIISLTEKVQKFWNGPSCTIVIEGERNLQEAISLLKKLIKR